MLDIRSLEARSSFFFLSPMRAFNTFTLPLFEWKINNRENVKNEYKKNQ